MTTEGDAIELLRQFLILRRETFDEFADKAVAAFGVVSAELTRLRERNAELERDRAALESRAESAWKSMDAEFTRSINDVPLLKRIASLESELDIANKQIAETGRAWTADRTRLEATVKEMREALLKSWTILHWTVGEGIGLDPPYYDPDDTYIELCFLLGAQDWNGPEEARSALASSESVVPK